MRAAVLGLLGRLEHANTAYKRILELNPDFHGRERDHVNFFVLDSAMADIMVEGLNKAVTASR